jgi:excisionase family DNA binding protein
MPYLTINEVRQRLRVSRWTVTRLIERGELTAIKAAGRNGAVKIDSTSLEAYIERHAVTPVAESAR